MIDSSAVPTTARRLCGMVLLAVWNNGFVNVEDIDELLPCLEVDGKYSLMSRDLVRPLLFNGSRLFISLFSVSYASSYQLNRKISKSYRA